MAMYKFIAVADLHMSNHLPMAKPEKLGITDRLKHQSQVWKEIYATARNEDVNAIFVLGDLFDQSRTDAITWKVTSEILAAAPCKIYILPGNHDANSIHGIHYTVEALGVLQPNRFITLGNRECLNIKSDGARYAFWSIPFLPLEQTLDELVAIKNRLDATEKNILLLHHSIIGCQHLEWICDQGLKVDVFENFTNVLSGHFHKTQSFGENGLYLGAPLHHNFGDVGRDAGYWIATCKKDGLKLDYKPTSAPKFYSAQSIDGVKFLNLTKGDYLRIELKRTNADWHNEKTAVQTKCSELNESGIHASYKHIPIYHHKSRTGVTDVSMAPTIQSALNLYVDSLGVETGNLELDELKKIGAEILREARQADGID